jgi:hypothetical protein
MSHINSVLLELALAHGDVLLRDMAHASKDAIGGNFEPLRATQTMETPY